MANRKRTPKVGRPAPKPARLNRRPAPAASTPTDPPPAATPNGSSPPAESCADAQGNSSQTTQSLLLAGVGAMRAATDLYRRVRFPMTRRGVPYSVPYTTLGDGIAHVLGVARRFVDTKSDAVYEEYHRREAAFAAWAQGTWARPRMWDVQNGCLPPEADLSERMDLPDQPTLAEVLKTVAAPHALRRAWLYNHEQNMDLAEKRAKAALVAMELWAGSDPAGADDAASRKVEMAAASTAPPRGDPAVAARTLNEPPPVGTDGVPLTRWLQSLTHELSPYIDEALAAAPLDESGKLVGRHHPRPSLAWSAWWLDTVRAVVLHEEQRDDLDARALGALRLVDLPTGACRVPDAKLPDGRTGPVLSLRDEGFSYELPEEVVLVRTQRAARIMVAYGATEGTKAALLAMDLRAGSDPPAGAAAARTVATAAPAGAFPPPEFNGGIQRRARAINRAAERAEKVRARVLTLARDHGWFRDALRAAFDDFVKLADSFVRERAAPAELERRLARGLLASGRLFDPRARDNSPCLFVWIVGLCPAELADGLGRHERGEWPEELEREGAAAALAAMERDTTYQARDLPEEKREAMTAEYNGAIAAGTHVECRWLVVVSRPDDWPAAEPPNPWSCDPAELRRFSDADYLTIALCRLGGLADAGNPRPIVPEPEYAVAGAIWAMMFPADAGERFPVPLAEAMLDHVEAWAAAAAADGTAARKAETAEEEAGQDGQDAGLALTTNDTIVLHTMARFDPVQLLSTEMIAAEMDAGARLSARTIGPIVRRLLDLGLVERPMGGRSGAKLSTQGRRLASKIAD